MPNRILRDWTDSLRFDGLSPEAERLFVRLIMKADDYGRFHANPQLVKSACFPLAESLRANTVAAWITELIDRQLVFSYTAGTGKFLQIQNYGQRLKQSRPKFPPPPGTSDDFRELPGTSRNFPPESESETETESETEKTHTLPVREIPDLPTVLAYAETIGLAPWRAEDEFLKLETNGWKDGKGQPIAKWKPYFTRVRGWWEADGRPSKPTTTNAKHTHTRARSLGSTHDPTGEIAAQY